MALAVVVTCAAPASRSAPRSFASPATPSDVEFAVQWKATTSQRASMSVAAVSLTCGSSASRETRWAPVMRSRATCAVTPGGTWRTISSSTMRFEDGMINPMRAVMPLTSTFPKCVPNFEF